MDKVLALVELKERINTVGYNRHHYIEEDITTGEKCFCSVGHLMDICGVDFTPFEEDDGLNGEVVGMVLSYLQPLVDLGFTLDELRDIQNKNDLDAKDRLNTYIDELIGNDERVTSEEANLVDLPEYE